MKFVDLSEVDIKFSDGFIKEIQKDEKDVNYVVDTMLSMLQMIYNNNPNENFKKEINYRIFGKEEQKTIDEERKKELLEKVKNISE